MQLTCGESRESKTNNHLYQPNLKRGVDRITDIFTIYPNFGSKTLVILRFTVPLASFNLYVKMLFLLIAATNENKLTAVGEAFQIRNI